MSGFQINIRPAKADDMPAVLNLIKELARYENASDEVTNSVEQLVADGFTNAPTYESLVAEVNEDIIGFALYFTTYSTWRGTCLYLEDICVTEQFRRKGVGKKLFDEVLTIARDRGVKRLSWQVLEWNTPAIEFYKKYQTEFDNEWVNCKIRLG